jgi:hypothetical protein
VVERAEQVGLDQLPEGVVAREVEVELQLLRGDLRQRLVGVVERRQPDVDAVLLLEVLEHPGER